AGDTTLNWQGLVTDTGMTAAYASVQLAGISGAGAAFGEYCGSDFSLPAHYDRQVLAEGADLAERIGQALAGSGYRGIFGVDIALDEDRLLVLEVNCRAQASTWLLGEAELESGALPMLCRHVVETQGCSTAPLPTVSAGEGAQLVV